MSPNNVRKCATHGIVLTNTRFFCDAEFDDCEPVRVRVFTDAELRARDERMIKASMRRVEWVQMFPQDIDDIISAAEADQ